jgi:hypothetical protein
MFKKLHEDFSKSHVKIKKNNETTYKKSFENNKKLQ